jgi:hypothetical protein
MLNIEEELAVCERALGSDGFMIRSAGNYPLALQEIMELRDKLRRIEALVRPLAQPGCNPATHSLAGKIVRILEGE